jgi:hypothetical protein
MKCFEFFYLLAFKTIDGHREEIRQPLHGKILQIKIVKWHISYFIH